VEQERQSDRRWEVAHNLEAIDDERIDQSVAHRWIGEQRREVVKSRPWAVEEAEIRRIILKGNDVAEEGQIPENDEKDESGENEGVHPAFPPDLCPDQRVAPAKPGQWLRTGPDGHR